MKNLYLVSKTHLDLGFTDYAAAIKEKYINSFIPGAISLGNQVNSENEKNFIWTTGSWIIKEALKYGSAEQKAALISALKYGNIVPHAMPFTTHTELLDEDTLDYGLSIVDELDKFRGRKTVAAKLTDVPGHTKGVVKLLAKHGIKLLHIGVNGASALPKVPECFLWKSDGEEVVVIYSGDYGGAFKSDIVDDILYFDHTLDNHGAPSADKVLDKVNILKKQFPDYNVTAGTMDDFADVIWEKRNELPVYTGEIGDTWIHGSSADPYKSAALRELMLLKLKWLADGTMTKDCEEYKNFSDSLICIAEHTCGMDMKTFHADYENYLKKDFIKARAKDKVKIKHLLRDFPHNIIAFFNRMKGDDRKGRYSTVEKSWAEQRLYIDDAVNSLNDEHKNEALAVLKTLRPDSALEFDDNSAVGKCFTCGDWSVSINENGGIGKLLFKGDNVITENNNPIAEYYSFGSKDYDFWLNHYTRNLKQTFGWSVPDFARPLLKYADGKYKTGRFSYKAVKSSYENQADNTVKIFVNLECDKSLCEDLGAPRLFQLIYHLTEDGLKINVSWFNKDANRLTEAVYLRFFPSGNKVTLDKIGTTVDPNSVASMGGRNLHAVFKAYFETKDNTFVLKNIDSPLISIGRGKILEIDDKLEDFTKDGIAYVLYNNVWGTNFPAWYEENAAFNFEITSK